MTLTAREGHTGGHLRAWVVGTLLLITLVVALLLDAAWPLKVGAWVLITLLLDECGGWFGYTGAAVGAVPFLGPLLAPHVPVAGTPPEWFMVFPLVFAGLLGMLLVKHSAGLLGLVLSVAALVAPILLARQVGPMLDASITLPGDPALLAWTLWPAVLGAALTLAWRVVTPSRSARP